ncbi:MAG TPA: translation elongation factor Ts [Candidatus Paceibacterota bacterium]|nr:translation elongation factor Ts [Candidatus Paceibacterota bacterium]
MDIEIIKQLRNLTNASVIECKNALEEAKGDIKKAAEILKRKGKSVADKKNTRETKSGIIEAYVHGDGRVGVLLDLRCETDFVAKNKLFKELAHEIALQIAAMAPQYVSATDIPEVMLEEEKEAYKKELKDSGKPENIVEQIVDGKLQKRYAEICLLSQPYIKDQEQTVDGLIRDYISKIGENIQVVRFARFEV